VSDLILESFRYWIRGGILLFPIAGVSFFIFSFFLCLKGRLSLFSFSETELDKFVKNGVLKENESAFHRVINYCLKKIKEGVDLRSAFREAYKKEISIFRREIIILEALTSTAPLLGLLGTVLGMIETFTAVSGESAYPQEVISQGIAKALITTQFGLVVALGGVICISFLRRKIRELEVKFLSIYTHLSLALRRK